MTFAADGLVADSVLMRLPILLISAHHVPGHINHTLFWNNLAPAKQGGGELSSGALQSAIEKDFGSLDGLKTKFNASLAGIQGSGWGWLGYDKEAKKLEILTTANQDPLLCESRCARRAPLYAPHSLEAHSHPISSHSC